MPSSRNNRDYRNFVFAGGGSRCFWQAGFWMTASAKLNFRPNSIGAVSAGSAMACMIQMNRVEETLNEFIRATAANARNVYPENALFRQPVFPQSRIYRRTLVNALNPSRLEQIREGADIKILSTKVPWPLGPTSGTMIGMATYILEKKIRKPVHPKLARHLGFEASIRSVQSCNTPDELVDLIMASSSTPPFTPVAKAHNRPVLDGGLIDNVPVEIVDSSGGDTLVLLTRQYPYKTIPQVAGRTYVQPSEPIPVSKWNYTSPHKIQATFELGLRDGERFADNA